MTADKFFDPRIQSSLDMIRRSRNGRVGDEPKEVGNRVDEKAPDRTEFAVRVPPASLAPGALLEEHRMPLLPAPEVPDPPPLLSSGPDGCKITDDAEKLGSGDRLWMQREPRPRLPRHVDEAALNFDRRPDLADGLQKASLRVADDICGGKTALAES